MTNDFTEQLDFLFSDAAIGTKLATYLGVGTVLGVSHGMLRVEYPSSTRTSWTSYNRSEVERFLRLCVQPSDPVQIEDLRRAVRQASFYDPETDPTKALTAAYAESLAKGSGWTKTVNGYPQHFPLDEVVQPREATNEALARENEDLKRRLAELESQNLVQVGPYHCVAPVTRGYAKLGTGRYVLQPCISAGDGIEELPSLVIRLATEEEQARRTVGDLEETLEEQVGVPIEKDLIACQLDFTSAEGLAALQQQLRLLAEDAFGVRAEPQNAKPVSLTDAAMLDLWFGDTEPVGLLSERVVRFGFKVQQALLAANGLLEGVEQQKAEPVNARLLAAIKEVLAADSAAKAASGGPWVTRHPGREAQARQLRAYSELHSAIEQAEAQKVEPVPVEAIGRILTEVMGTAVENGASSVSMPDDYVAVAAWLCRVEGAEPQKAEPTRLTEEQVAKVDTAICEASGWADKPQKASPVRLTDRQVEELAEEIPTDFDRYGDRQDKKPAVRAIEEAVLRANGLIEGADNG